MVIVTSLVVNILMQLAKRLAGFKWTDNPNATVYLRVALAILSIAAALVSSVLTGADLDSASIATWMGVIVEAIGTFFLSHGMYDMVIRKA